MASLIYDNALLNEAKGLIDFDSDTFKVMLVTSSYTPDKANHAYRSSVTNEVSGTGYTAGGASAGSCTVAIDTVNHRVDITLAAASWPTSTITARGAVYYKSRGGASSADEVVAYIDFGADIASTSGTFSLTASTLRKQN